MVFWWRFGLLAVLTSAVVCPAFADSPKNQPPRLKAREDVEFLVDGVESSYDCEITLDSLVSRLDAVDGHFTVAIRLDGEECEEAFRALKLRSIFFPFSFIALPDAGSEAFDNDP